MTTEQKKAISLVCCQCQPVTNLDYLSSDHFHPAHKLYGDWVMCVKLNALYNEWLKLLIYYGKYYLKLNVGTVVTTVLSFSHTCPICSYYFCD